MKPEYDEFGRVKFGDRKRSGSTQNNADEQYPRKTAPEWPPAPFETNGGAYTFDERSSLFYEPLSDFFYDPARKTFYGNRQKTYYEYDPTLTPPSFRALSTLEEVKEQQRQQEQSMAHETTKQKTQISIQIKFAKKRPSSKRKREDTPAENTVKASTGGEPGGPLLNSETNKTVSIYENESSVPMPKDVEKNIRTWDQASVKEAKSRKFETTPLGEPICTLCQRKFKSKEQLDRHERLSQLHKSNLEKKQLEYQYVDRAAYRRAIHSADSESARPGVNPDRVETAVVRPQDTLNEGNIGNKMLQKMGWKRVNDTETGGDGIRSEWERIEKLAKSDATKN